MNAEVPVQRGSRLPLSASYDMVLAENARVLGQVDPDAVERFTDLIVTARRVFVVGEGRSGLAVRMAAMRFMHLGYRVHVVGETTTPAVGTGDVLLAVSGSGTTGLVLMAANGACRAGGQVAAVTTVPGSPLGEVADLVVCLPAAAKQDQSRQRSRQFAGSLFEQSVLLFFDSLIHALASAAGTDHGAMWARHTNLDKE